ncbi:MAG: Lipopolysaccharide biosynthesis protein WzxC [Pseudomonadota bacterium]
MSDGIAHSVRRAVIWRSGSQIFAQVMAWAATLAVVRILGPADYGLFAMTQVVLAFLSFLNGYGFASSLVQEKEVSTRQIRQAFGILILVNGSIALIQLAIAPFAAAWYRQEVVAHLLQVQTLIFVATPFIALPEVLLIRELDFRRPAIVNIVATLVSSTVSLSCALLGCGVWTLVFAPLAFFWSRAIGLVIATRFFILPSFRFDGAGRMVNYGLMMLGSHFFWTLVTQSDVFIASRSVDAHQLGLYAEAMFLTSLITSKFVPPLNEVAFPAYARMQDDPARMAAAFLKAVRLILLVTCPLYFGLAVTAPDVVQLVLGTKWAGMAPLVTVLALGMPAMTLHILFAPAANAAGLPHVTMRASLVGALVMPLAFIVGVRHGVQGLAWAWLMAFPVVPLFAWMQCRGPMELDGRGMARAILPALGAAAAMALPVHALGQAMHGWSEWGRLAAQVAFGGLLYAAILYLVSRATLEELLGLVLHRPGPPQPTAASC